MSREIGRLNEELRERRRSILEMHMAALFTCALFAVFVSWDGELRPGMVGGFVCANLVGAGLNGLKRLRMYRSITAKREKEPGWRSSP